MNLDQFSAHRRDEDEITFSRHNTAVLVIDMLNDFCVEGGAMVLPGSERLLPAQNSVINTVREGGGVVAFIIDSHRPDLRRDREFLKRSPHCVEGSWGAQVMDGLDQHDDDLRILKRRYSGFFNGARPSHRPRLGLGHGSKNSSCCSENHWAGHVNPPSGGGGAAPFHWH